MKLAILNILIQVETAEKRRQEAETEAKQLEFTKNELEVKDIKISNVKCQHIVMIQTTYCQR